MADWKDYASDGIKGIVKLLGITAPVPGMYPAAECIIAVIILCENVPKQRKAAKATVERCRCLLKAIGDERETLETKGEMGRVLDEVLQIGHKITGSMKVIIQTGNVKGFIAQTRFNNELKQANDDINSVIERFHITALAELHRWQQRFEKQSRADHEEVIAGIKNLENATAEIEQLVKAQTQVIADANVKQDKQHAELVGYLAVVQHIFKSVDREDNRYKGFRRSLYRIMDKPGRTFADPNLDHGEIEWISKVPIETNGLRDVYEGLYMGEKPVALKMMRAVRTSGPSYQEKDLRRFRREVGEWSKVYEYDKGVFILPIFGYLMPSHGEMRPYIVTPLTPNGTAFGFVRTNPGADRKELIVRFALGVRVLHRMGKAHNSLTGDAALVDNNGYPLLANFTYTKDVGDQGKAAYTSDGLDCAESRFNAPEILNVQETGELVNSLAADVWSFGMIVLQLLTGEYPYKEHQRWIPANSQIAKGIPPKRPLEEAYVRNGLTDAVWKLLVNGCWQIVPEARLSIQDVVRELTDAWAVERPDLRQLL